MKQTYLTILFAMLMSMVGAKAENRGDILNAPKGASGVIEINEENFPDEIFRDWLLRQDYGQDGKLTEDEINGITYINVRYYNISSLKGIEYFTALIKLDCQHNQLTSLDVSNNTALTDLYCNHNQLTSLDVSKNTALTQLDCDNNQLTSLDVSNHTALIYLFCNYNQLTSLDVSNNTALTDLYCNHNQLTSLDVSKNTALTSLYCTDNQLTSLDVSNTALTFLNCSYNQLTSLDVSKNTALTLFFCYDNHLTSLDVSKNTALIWLHCYNNQLTSLDVSNTALTELYCYSNQIKGEAMDALISGLPQTDKNYGLYIYYSGNDGNVCTKAQVAAAKAKGWTPYYTTDGRQWYEYEGSDEGADGINAVSTDKQGKTAIYTLDGKRLQTTNAADLPTGIYIINGKKQIVK